MTSTVPPARGARRGRRAALKLGLALCAAAVALAALEGLARALERLRPDRATAQTRLPPKAPGAFRVLAYGGSTVAGLPIPEWGFLAQLEFWMRQARPDQRLEIFNLAVPGGSSTRALWALERTIRREPDVLIVLSGHNEYLHPRVEGRLYRRLLHSALYRSALRVAGKAFGPRFGSNPFSAPRTYDRDSALFREKARVYRENLRAMAALAQRRGVPLVLLTAPSNLADWPPAGATPPAALGGAPAGTAAPEAAALFESARSRAAAADYEAARALFERARDLDPVPWRALSEFNRAVRETAAEFDAVLVDAEAALTAHAEHGLVGFDLICDNCHPTPRGQAIIAQELLRGLAARKLWPAPVAAPADPDERLAVFLNRTLTPPQRRALESKYCFKTGRYAMLTPFFNFGAARMYFERGLALDDRDWRLYANLASLALLEGRCEEGRRLLEAAARCRGGALDPQDRRQTPYLKEALERMAAR